MGLGGCDFLDVFSVAAEAAPPRVARDGVAVSGTCLCTIVYVLMGTGVE